MKNALFLYAAPMLAAALTCTCLVAEAAAPQAAAAGAPVVQRRQTVQPVRPFRGQMPWGAPQATSEAQRGIRRQRAEAATEPTATFSELSYYDYLEGPDGETWFYTTDYDIERVEYSEWWVEDYIVGYTFTVYDAAFQLVGTIHDRVTLGPGETSVASAVLDPAASAHFFNDDDRIEAMVYLAMKTGPDYGYEVRYYNKVYSIGGERDAEGCDVSIATMSGRCVDTFSARDAAGQEQCFYTFVEDVYPDPDDFNSDQYLDYINAAKTVVSIYARPAGATAPEVVYTKDIYMTRYPGDTTDGIYLITKTGDDGTPYFVFSHYEKPYFVDPTGFATDENATEDNSLLIEVYAYVATTGMTEVSTTRIPVEIEKVAGEINYTFYSIGSVAWKDDVDMSVNGTPQAPAFLVARDFTKASNLEQVATSFDIYGNDGQHLHALAERVDGINVLASVAGTQPQALFVSCETEVGEGGGEVNVYTFDFVDLYSGERVLRLPQVFQDEPLTAVCQRVPSASDARGYHYVFELQYDAQDADGNDLKRVLWVSSDGTQERIDHINMGPDIMAASVNMFPESLSPTLYDDDEAMEYAVLVKRQSGNTTKNEFLVVDDDGAWYARFSEADGKGSPMMFTIVPGLDRNRLQMVYRTDDYTYNVDIYDLPFATESSLGQAPEADLAARRAIALRGTTLVAPGHSIAVYSAVGVRVAAGQEEVSLATLPHGSYVVVARDAAGSTVALKVTR